MITASRPIGPIVVAVLYVALSSFLVGAVGRAHRQSLLESEPTATPPPSTAAAAPREAGDPSPAPVVAVSPKASSPMTVEATRPADPVPPASSIREPEKPAAVPPVAVAKSAPATEKPAAPALAAATPQPLPLVLKQMDPFFGTPAATRKWDFKNWNVEKEAELGRELNAMVLRFNNPSSDGALQRRVLDAKDPLLKGLDRPDLKYHFTVLDSDAINAFSHPGGYVYVTRGLLDWISPDEEEALQFALAHEIFHVDRGHALLCLQDKTLQKLELGTLTTFYLFFFPRAYPDEAEFAADDWALLQLRKLGGTRRMCLKFLDKLDAYAGEHGFLEGRAFPEPGRTASLFENHFRAHPSARERAMRLLAKFDQAPPARP